MKDEQYEKSKEKELIEVLVNNVWVPAMGTDLRLMNKNCELIKVKSIRVRSLED